MVIQHNLVAMNNSHMLNITGSDLAKSAEKLSSGYKINRAADDAAGLSISEKMRKQIRGLTKADENVEDGISMMQIADGALAEVHEMLNRGTELSIKAANGTLSANDRKSIQDEIEQLKTEIDAIAERTYFNEIQVLKGEGAEPIPTYTAGTGLVVSGTLPTWVVMDTPSQTNGYMSSVHTTTVNFTDDTGVVTPTTINHVASNLDFSAFDGTATKVSELVGSGFYFTCCTCSSHYSIKFTDDTVNSTEESGDHYIFNIGIAGATTGAEIAARIIDSMDKDAAGIGNPNGHYTKVTSNGATIIVYDDRSMDSNPYAGVNGTWSDWDIQNRAFGVKASAYYGKFGPGVAEAEMVISGYRYKDSSHPLALQVGAETCEFMYINLPSLSCRELGIKDADVSSMEGSNEAIRLFQLATVYINKERSRVGAYQNRLEHTHANLGNVVENTTAAESRIRDTDMSTEMVRFSNTQILQQAGQSMLAQSKQANQGVLSLIA